MPASKKFNQLCFHLEIKRDPDLEYGLIHFLFHGCEMATPRLERLVFTGKRCGCFDSKCAEMGTRFSLQVPVDGGEAVPDGFFRRNRLNLFSRVRKKCKRFKGIGEEGSWDLRKHGRIRCGGRERMGGSGIRMDGLWEWGCTSSLYCPCCQVPDARSVGMARFRDAFPGLGSRCESTGTCDRIKNHMKYGPFFPLTLLPEFEIMGDGCLYHPVMEFRR
ncbi:hypothetical protein B4135_2487 [Caldibacillus debilis]|uniref:Uncharacterized protein n=1 Tax=Caldibacillus debilis TaxID=301148 RepID=A0A150LYZ0_9BACI|nr:hypothetical protein B4135_2487 [Caldibacillus debilis]